jgi:uncharacterized protein (TIGR02266 family)
MSKSEKTTNENHLTERLMELIKNLPKADQLNLLNELEAWQFEGKRKHHRKPFFMVVDYATKEGAFKDFIQNISAGGVFIETRMPFSVGQEISMTFTLPKFQKPFKVNGKIVRTLPDGIGVAFLMENQEQEDMVQSLLEMI